MSTTQSALVTDLRCEWVGANGDQQCASLATKVVVVGDDPHVACAAHATADPNADPLDNVFDIDAERVPSDLDMWVVVRDLPSDIFPGDVIVAWNEPDAAHPDVLRSTCAWFSPESPDAAPVAWPEFDAYYEILCDPAELDSDDIAGAEAAAAEVRDYLQRLHPDPSLSRVFRCEWPAEADGIDGGSPDHGWGLVIPVRVRAAFSAEHITGSDLLWPVSAQAVVDANSWTGAEHGWGVGCQHWLTIIPAGETPDLVLRPLDRSTP